MKPVYITLSVYSNTSVAFFFTDFVLKKYFLTELKQKTVTGRSIYASVVVYYFGGILLFHVTTQCCGLFLLMFFIFSHFVGSYER